MDTLGDAEPVDDDGAFEEYDDGDGGRGRAARPTFLTPETLAVTGAFLVLFSFFAGGLSQFLSYLVSNNGNGFDQAEQYAIYAGPSGAIAALGASMGWRATREAELDRWLRGLSGAAVITGVLVALLTAAGIGVAFTAGDRGPF